LSHLSAQARDVYEEAIQTVLTVRDFGEVFDAYAQVRCCASLPSSHVRQFEETALTTEVQGTMSIDEGVDVSHEF
jgi:pre-mRNA-splicing factor SYF1